MWLKSQNLQIVIGLAIVTALVSCGKEDGDTESMSELAAANISGIANSTEQDGTLATYMPAKKGYSLAMSQWFTLLPLANAAGQCPILKNADCGESGLVVLEYNDCHHGSGVWNGSQSFEFSSLAVCQARTSSRYGVPLSGSLLRTFGGSLAENPTTRTLGNRQISFDTATARGYSTPVSGGTRVEYGESDQGESLRTVNINGLSLVSKNLKRDKVLWDISLFSDSANPIKILRVGKQREVLSGTVSVQHNIAQYTASSKILSPLTFSQGCCHPVSGSIESIFSGSKTGSETLSFHGDCGSATLKASDGSEVAVALRHCF